MIKPPHDVMKWHSRLITPRTRYSWLAPALLDGVDCPKAQRRQCPERVEDGRLI